MPPLWLIGIFARSGVAAKLQRGFAWLSVVAFFAITLTIAVLLWRSWLDGERDNAIAEDRVNISAIIANQTLAADREASVNASITAEIDQQNEKELDDAARNGDKSNVGPGVSDVLARMRQQQANGKR